jgi:hypothetical protein
MSKQTYKGSCHCGRVWFEADLDLSQGTSKCNCTQCWKKRWWSVRCGVEDFRSLEGESELVKDSAFSTGGPGGFCKQCGVRPYCYVDPAEWNPEPWVAVNVAALDDLDPALLLASPVTYCDGRNDDWWHPPSETRHL